MIYDIITYNGEWELFEIRYNILKDFVDEFRVIEFDKTFSGRPKRALFRQRFDKVKHYFVTEDIWSKYKDLAVSSPNTQYGKGAQHWVTEFCQKEAIKDCLTDLKDHDKCFIGDCDEVYENYRLFLGLPAKLKLRVYSYYLNNRSSEGFWGTLVAFYKTIKGECLNHLRANTEKTVTEQGWHFTSIGGYEKVRQKLTDSYTEETYAPSIVLENLERNIQENHDFLGRGFTYKKDESEWPRYLKDNKEKYKHLLR